MRRPITLGIVAMVALTAAACGDSNPTAPTPPPPAVVSGTWSGTFEFGAPLQQRAITMELTQAGGNVNGTWAVQTSGWNGAVTGTVDSTTFSGSLTFNARSVTGAACTGQGSFSGAAGGTTLSWSSPGITGNCTGMPTSIRIVLQRR